MQRTAFYPLEGGLDLISPAITIPPGRCIAAVNHEPSDRGYRRMDGLERLDGRPKPSEASYWVLNFDVGDTEVQADDVVTGGTSGATGIALIDGVLETGTYVGGDATGYLVLTQVVGTFQDDEDLEVSASQVADADGLAVERGADNDDDDMTWHHAAIERAREQIEKVPGSGPIRGVWTYAGSIWAIRDNAGATAGVLHKATTSGWVAQSLGRELAFTSGGTTEIVEGDTITGATSAATAVVTRVVLDSGTWAGGDAAGRFIFASQTGTFQAENIDVGASTNLATIAGDSSAILLEDGGRYNFTNYNFFGVASSERMYGSGGGVGRGFEWDGTVFVPIETGLSAALEKPTRVAVHKNHLFFAYANGVIQNSETGNPYDWDATGGAAEIGLGHEVTDFVESVQNVLIVFGVNQVAALYGSDSSDWELRILADDAGAAAWTAQKMNIPYYLDRAGVRGLEYTEEFGDFRRGTTTRLVEPLIRSKLRAGVTAAGSIRVRAKDQYRLFWSDGSGLILSFLREMPEILPIDLGTIVVSSSCSGEDADDKEILLIGSTDGWVYQVDSGTSLDGEAVTAFLRLPFNHVGYPTQDKRWHKLTLEVDAGPSNVIGVVPEFSYADPDQPSGAELSFSVRGGGGFWEEDLWDNIYFDSPVEGLAEAHIDGIGRNCSAVIFSEETYSEPYSIHGATYHFSPRRLVR